MTFSPLHPPVSRAKSKSGIAFTRRTLPRGDTATLTINRTAQEELFGRNIAGERLEVLVGRAEDEGCLLIRLLEDGRHEDRPSHPVHNLMRGAVRVKLRPWDLLGDHEAAGGGCEVEQASERGVVLRLPDWCQPEARKARVAAKLDVGLKVKKGDE